MAIDNAEKRRSASGPPFHPLGPGVTPNAAKDAEWRFQSGWGYSGIAVASPSTAVVAVAERAMVYRSGGRKWLTPRS